MKKILVAAALAVLIISCKSETKEKIKLATEAVSSKEIIDSSKVKEKVKDVVAKGAEKVEEGAKKVQEAVQK